MQVRNPIWRARWRIPLVLRLAAAALLFSAGHAGAQTLDAAQAQFLHGRYAEVIKTAQKELAADSYRADWRRLLVESLLMVGRYEEADTNATAGLNDYSANIALRLLARETALYANRPAEANRRLLEIKVLLEQRRPEYQDGAELVALGQALLLLGVEPRLVLENCFQRAEGLNSPPREAFLAAGQLALDKHDFKLAAEAFQAGLEKFPGDPDLECGLAQAYESGDTGEMLPAIEAALAANPKHIATLLLLADHLIDAEQYGEAEKQLALVLSVNPSQPEALAYRAVLAQLRNDPEAARQFRAEALKHYQRNPAVDQLIGRKLSEKYRFAEGAAAQRRALAFVPDYEPARQELAEDLLRLGQDDEGWALAESVHKDDAYDVTAYNLCILHDQMVKYQTLTNSNFIVRMTTNEAGLYGDLVLDLLSRARETLCRKYDVELKQPTTVEIFPEQKDFAVRTFGMPGNPGYLGVCFGPVITANSPASQAPNPANWEDVLWHEFCHVVTLTATKNRMPRWLSEGISVYEERQANPKWGERMNLAYRDMILKGELTPLSELSGAFLTPSNSVHLQFAYFESSLVVQFIVQRFGLDALKSILRDLGEGDEVYESIARRTAPLPEMEKQFAAFARAQAGQLAPGVDLDLPPHDESKLNGWELVHPENYYVRLHKAAALMEAKNWPEAESLLAALADAYHGERRADNPLWLLAVTQRNLGQTNAELATLKKFAAQESDFADLYSRLIELSEGQKNWLEVTKYAEQLLAINPLSSLPYRALAEASVAAASDDHAVSGMSRAGETPAPSSDQAITAYRKLLLLDPPDPVEVHFQLAKLLHARGDSEDEAKRQILQSLEDAPRFQKALSLLLEIEDRSRQPTAQRVPVGGTRPATPEIDAKSSPPNAGAASAGQ
ncbi:MAG TPA: tetratricopeptide repeat protein [Candidatus Acidoferrales bacterium]|nr:tetratricopeptide repeat protein [Candidatus Acidoferrales bacterium]